MAIVRFDPLRELRSLQEGINRLFSDASQQRSDFGNEIAMGSWRPPVDILDTENSIVIYAELPGIAKEKLSIEAKDNMLTIRGERPVDKETEKGSYYRSERVFGIFERSFAMPLRIDAEKIRASFKDGVLKVEIPKPEEKKPKQITIQ